MFKFIKWLLRIGSHRKRLRFNADQRTTTQRGFKKNPSFPWKTSSVHFSAISWAWVMIMSSAPIKWWIRPKGLFGTKSKRNKALSPKGFAVSIKKPLGISPTPTAGFMAMVHLLSPNINTLFWVVFCGWEIVPMNPNGSGWKRFIWKIRFTTLQWTRKRMISVCSENLKDNVKCI